MRRLTDRQEHAQRLRGRTRGSGQSDEELAVRGAERHRPWRDAGDRGK